MGCSILEREMMKFKGYDAEYHDNLLHMYAGSMPKISNIRWKLIAGLQAKTILDYGSGNNGFSLFRPDGIVIDSYDIGTIKEGVKYPQTGIRHTEYDLICLWDVIEHVDWRNNPDEFMLEWISKAKNLAMTVPIKPKDTVLEKWKHYKPGEHLTYFSISTLIKFVEGLGFSRLEHSQPECPPRQDIHSFLFRRLK